MSEKEPSAPARREGENLRGILRPVRGRIIAGVALQGVAAVTSLAPFVAIYLMAAELLEPQVDQGAVWRIVLVAAAALAVRFAAESLSYVLMHDADMEVQLRLRRRVAGHLSRLPLGWFGARNSAAVKKALADDIDAIHYRVAHALPDVTMAVVTPAAALAYLFWLDWRLTLVTLLTAPVFGVLFRVMGRRGGRQGPRLANAIAGVNAAVIEFVQGIAVIKAFGQRDRAGERFTRAVDEYMEVFASVKGPILRLSSLAYAVVSPAAMLMTSTIGGTVFVAAGLMGPLDVLPFVLLGLGLTAPLVIVTYAPQAFSRSQQAADRIAGLLAEQPLPEPERPLLPQGNRVEFTDVAFGYQPDRPVLSGVRAVLEPGTVTALVGPSGAGKSTMAALLPRLFDPDGGSVSIGGVDLRDISTRELYRHVSFVFQDVHLIRASIADNIRLARPQAPLSQVHAAARAAHCHERILGLPRGYDSVVGEDAELSGGERQRISIARALLADTPVLVLDEATALVDPHAEAGIYDALSALVAGRTVLMVAHRLHTVVDADQIIVLDNGRIAQRGTHQELVEADGVYRRLWEAYEEAATADTGRPGPELTTRR